MKKYREENWKIQLRHWLTFWAIGETAVNVLELILLDAIKEEPVP